MDLREGVPAWQPEEIEHAVAGAESSKPPGWDSVESLPKVVLKPRSKWQRLRLNVLTGDFRGLPDPLKAPARPHRRRMRRSASADHAALCQPCAVCSTGCVAAGRGW